MTPGPGEEAATDVSSPKPIRWTGPNSQAPRAGYWAAPPCAPVSRGPGRVPDADHETGRGGAVGEGVHVRGVAGDPGSLAVTAEGTRGAAPPSTRSPAVRQSGSPGGNGNTGLNGTGRSRLRPPDPVGDVPGRAVLPTAATDQEGTGGSETGEVAEIGPANAEGTGTMCGGTPSGTSRCMTRHSLTRLRL